MSRVHWWSVGLAVLGIDQALKFVLLRFWPEVVIGNRGVAFGLMSSLAIQYQVFIIAIALFSLVLYLAVVRNVYWLSLGAALFVAGSLSNLFDRVRTGYVIDYLPLGGDVSINLGDVSIVVGTIILLYFVIVPSPGQSLT